MPCNEGKCYHAELPCLQQIAAGAVRGNWSMSIAAQMYLAFNAGFHAVAHAFVATTALEFCNWAP